MADGSTKNIEDVEPGDEVITYNTDTGEHETHVVTALFSKQAEVLLEITVTEDTTSNQDSTGDRVAGEVSGTDPPASSDSLTVTPEHPFWEPTEETWTPAGDLQPGDHLLQRDGDLLTITSITTPDRTTPFTVYNFTVAGTHNYYATTLDTLVHNCGSGAKDGGGLSEDELLEASIKLRDEFSQQVFTQHGRKSPATVTAGYNVETGQYAAGYNVKGACAEMCVMAQLGGDIGNIRFTSAIRPRTGGQVPVCLVCEARYSRSPFVQVGTLFRSDFFTRFY